MNDLQEQLAKLRRRIARIDKKYARKPPAAQPRRSYPERWLNGSEIETDYGRHYELDKLYERHRRHGSIGICDLEDLPVGLLTPISNGEIGGVPPDRWCFLDTETAGPMGSVDTYAFLIGVGRITSDGFRVRQFFLRDKTEEASALAAISTYLGQFEVMITYNGRTFDQPLLEARFQSVGLTQPFSQVAHLDLLFGARRLWNLRFESCRLVDLENQILGVEREGDLPGELIPYVYCEYLRTSEVEHLIPIFHHNQTDILTLACFTAIVPLAFHEPGMVQFSHGAEMVGLGRWWRQAGKDEQALALFRRAVDGGLDDDLLFRTLWDIAALEKKLRRPDAALLIWEDLAGCRNPWRAGALEELAKHYERRERDYTKALELTRTALRLSDSEALRKRAVRLEKRLTGATQLEH